MNGINFFGGLDPLPPANQNNLDNIIPEINQLFTDIGNYQQIGGLLVLSERVDTLSHRIARGVPRCGARTDELAELQTYLKSSRFKVLPEDSYEKKVHQQLVYASKNIFVPTMEYALPSTRFTHHLSKALGPTWIKVAQLALITGGVVGYLYLDEKRGSNDGDGGKKHVESTATFMTAMTAAAGFYVYSAGLALYRACKLNPRDDG